MNGSQRVEKDMNSNIDNPRFNNSAKIIRNWIRKANGINKYNPSFHHMLENVTGIPSDRDANDTGIEPIK